MIKSQGYSANQENLVFFYPHKRWAIQELIKCKVFAPADHLAGIAEKVCRDFAQETRQ